MTLAKIIISLACLSRTAYVLIVELYEVSSRSEVVNCYMKACSLLAHVNVNESNDTHTVNMNIWIGSYDKV